MTLVTPHPHCCTSWSERGSKRADPEDKTPLHLACIRGHLTIVRTLLCEFDADVNSRDNENDTALNNASLGGHTEVVHALITEFGCTVDFILM